MTPNMQMEQRSLVVVRAVAADAGYQVVRPEPDVDSVGRRSHGQLRTAAQN